MPAPKKRFGTMDEYIKTFPNDVQRILRKLRETIRKAAPGAEETISYQIPTFTLNGRSLVYFAAWRTHVSIYPIPTGTAGFRKELAPYKRGKGTVQFPLNRAVPYDLVREIVRFRMKESSPKKR